MGIFYMKYTTSEFAALCDVTPENIRDWRRRGFDVGLSVAVSGRKMYCAYDLLEVQVWKTLRKLAFDDLGLAFRVAREITPAIAVKAKLDMAGNLLPGRDSNYLKDKRFALISGREDIAFTNDISHFLNRDVMAEYMAPLFYALDVDDLHNQLSNWIDESGMRQ